MKISRIPACISIILLMTSFQSFASDDNPAPIVITPGRIEESYRETSRSVDVLSSDTIESSEGDASKALSTIPSLNISNYGGLSGSKTLRLRGSTGAQVLVLIDGRPVNSPRDGEIDLSTIPLDNIGSIEIMRGPGSSLYGTGAMGGTVNFISKRPPQEKQKTEMLSSFGTYRTFIEKMSTGGRISKFGYLFSGGYQSSEGYRKNSEFNSKDFNSKLEYELNDQNNLTFDSGFFRSRAGSPGMITSPDDDDKQIVFKNYLDGSWKFKPDEASEIAFQGYQNHDRLEFLENTAGSMFDTANSKAVHTTVVRGINLQVARRFMDTYQAVGGINYVTNSNNSTFSAKHRYNVKAAYLNNEFDVTEKLKVDFGGRLDDYSNFGTEFNPSLSAAFKFNENDKIHGLISRSFRAPTFNDLYWPDEGWAKGNSTLKPETGITKEIGFQKQINKYILSDLTYYRSDYDDLINWSEVSGVWQPINIGSAVIDGIELTNSFFLCRDFVLDVGYTYLRAIDSKTHTYLVYQPKNKADFTLKYKNLSGWSADLTGKYTGARYHSADNSTSVKQFFVLGVDIKKQINNNLTVFGSIDNMLNRKYEVIKYYPMPGFSVTGGVKLEF